MNYKTNKEYVEGRVNYFFKKSLDGILNNDEDIFLKLSNFYNKLNINPRIQNYFNKFKLNSTRYPEVAFLSIVKDYNKFVIEESNNHKYCFNKIKIFDYVKDLEGSGYKIINFQLAENMEEITKLIKEFGNNVTSMFVNYFRIKYESVVQIDNYNLPPDMKDEMCEFLDKYVEALRRETIFSKDIKEIVNKYAENPEKYELQKVKEVIIDILEKPLEIESGYVQMIKQIESDISKAAAEENNDLECGLNKNTNVEINNKERDGSSILNMDQKTTIMNLLNESSIFLKNIVYTKEQYILTLHLETQELKEIVLEITTSIITNCKNILESYSESSNMEKGCTPKNITKNNKTLYELPNLDFQTLTINFYLKNMFGYEEFETDIEKIVTECVLSNNVTKLKLLIRYAKLNNFVLYFNKDVIKESIKNNNESTKLLTEYARENDIIINLDDDEIVNYEVCPNTILKFVYNNNQYEFTDITIKTFEEVKDKPYPNAKERKLDRIGNSSIQISRNIETYREFKMYCCKNQEIQLLSLAKTYNRLICNNSSNKDHEFKKIKFQDNLIHLDNKHRFINFHIIERSSDLPKVKSNFKEKMITLFMFYLKKKYGNFLSKENNIPKEMKKDIIEFSNDLSKALRIETIFAKDIDTVMEQLNDKNENYDPKNMKITINNIINYRLNVEYAYLAIIKHIKSEFLDSNENDSNDTPEPNTEPNNDKSDPVPINKFDELNKEQRSFFKSLLFELPYYLKNLKYSYYEKPGDYDTLGYDMLWVIKKPIDIAPSIIEQCNELLNKHRPSSKGINKNESNKKKLKNFKLISNLKKNILT